MFKYALIIFILNIPTTFIMAVGCGFGSDKECRDWQFFFPPYLIILALCIVLFNFKYTSSSGLIGISDNVKKVFYIILIISSVLPLLAGLAAFGDDNY